MRPLLPGLGLALFALWAGTFFSGAGAAATACALAALLLAAGWGRAAWSDPLELGPAGRLLPWALWLILAASLWASPVPRAGWLAALLFPAFLLVVPATARCLEGSGARGRGLALVCGVVAAVAAWGLVDWLWLGSPRPAMPLGHHNLLAAWLVTLLPLAGLVALDPGWRRWLGIGGCGLGAAAVVSTGSLAGIAALAGQTLALAVGIGWRRHRGIGVATALVVLAGAVALAAPRLDRMARGDDPSAQARIVYTEAGWAGFLERPLLGWGPGSSSWLAARELRPRPGVNPPGEVVGDLHSLPLQVLYELGMTGGLLAVALVALFGWRRLGALGSAGDRPLVLAGLLGVGGFLVSRLAGGELGVTALPVAAAVAAGAAVAGGGDRRRPSGGGRGAGVYLYMLLVAVVLAPLLLAQGAYDRAARSPDPERALQRLDRAARLDPAFPLYSARAAWLRGASGSGEGGAAGEALAAAEGAVGVAPFWLGAGALGGRAGWAWAPEALERAWELDPFGALAPFHLAALRPDDPRAPCWAAAAIVREPRLLAASLWQERPGLRARAVEAVLAEGELEPWWRSELARLVEALAPPTGASAELGLAVDREAAVSLSLHLFHRRPWSGRLATVEVDRTGAEALALVAATTVSTHPRRLFLRRCPAGSEASAAAVEKPVEGEPAARRRSAPGAPPQRFAQRPVQGQQVFLFL